MKLVLIVAAFLVSFGAMAEQSTQIVLNVPREDFGPLQQVNWKLMIGSSSLNTSEGVVSRTGNGLGFAVERFFGERIAIGAHYANIRSTTSDVVYTDGLLENGSRPKYEYRENINMFDIYGKYSFINYPVNKWNLIQVSILGGGMALDRHSQGGQLIYGVAASYNYDNLIGFELNTKVNFDAEAFTSANLIGYF